MAEIRRRGPQPNLSTLAFTATPKSKTLEFFGTAQPDGSFHPFSLYSMRQAIEEGFIMDVLENYTTYRAYWSLHKKVEENPSYERRRATAVLTHYVDLHEHAIEQKVAIIVEHFATHVAHLIDGQAKAMLVTRSRLHAVRYKLALDRYLRQQGYPYQTLVAFSGTVSDPLDGQRYTEAGMNGLPETQTADAFKQAKYRFLVAAYKFQTGFDQPLLAAMYVDKVLRGVHAVQTLSRLNRVHPGKESTYVLDFINEADDIQKAFAPYYEATLLGEPTDPNLLYDLQQKLDDALLYTQEEVDKLAEVWFTAKREQEVQPAHSQIHNLLQPAVDRFKGAPEEDQEAFRGYLKDYVRLYAFLSQIITFVDTDLEKLYVLCRLLQKLLPSKRAPLPHEITGQVDLETYMLQLTHEGRIELERGPGELEPQREKGQQVPEPKEMAALSEIVQLLNERFGFNIRPKEGEQFIQALEQRLAGDEALAASVEVNPPEKVRLTFDQVLNDRIQDIVDISFQFYKLLNDEPGFAQFFRELMYKRYMQGAERQRGA